MKYPLEVGVLTGPVTVGFVEKPDVVWLSLDVPREALMDKLETAKLKKFEKVESGSVAATVFSEDGALYRVSVLGVDHSRILELLLNIYISSREEGACTFVPLGSALQNQVPCQMFLFQLFWQQFLI